MPRARMLVDLGIEAARDWLPRVQMDGGYPDAAVWVLAHGFFNGFYSVIETLLKVESQPAVADKWLRQAIKEWATNSKESREARISNWRNLMTHQGEVLGTRAVIKWETDHFNDTVYQTRSHSFATVQLKDGTGYDITFERWALDQFLWLDRSLSAIEVRYNRLQRLSERGADTAEREGSWTPY